MLIVFILYKMRKFINNFCDIVEYGSMTIAVDDGGFLAKQLSDKYECINVVEKSKVFDARRKLSHSSNVEVIENVYPRCWKTLKQDIVICKPDVEDKDVLAIGEMGGIDILDVIGMIECKYFCLIVPYNFTFDALINKYPNSIVIRYIDDFYCAVIDGLMTKM